MSYLNPGIDTQHLINSAVNSHGLGSLGRIEDTYRLLNMSPEQFDAYLRRMKKLRESAPLCQTDETLVKLGSDVKQLKDGTKSIEKFNSGWTQVKLKQMKSGFSEEDLLKNVSKVKGDCDLRGTTISDLSSLKKVGGTLTVDTASKLKSLSGIEEVLGSVMVHAKNESTAKEFLQSLGLNLSAIKGKIIPVIKNYL